MVTTVVQDSSSSGDNVKRLDADSKAQMKEIEQSIEAKKKEVRRCAYACMLHVMVVCLQ